MMPMKLLRKRRAVWDYVEKRLGKTIGSLPTILRARERSRTENLAVAAVWVAGGVSVVTLGLLAGRELRGRYQFKRRTPYDYYAHSGDRSPDLDYSVGI